MLLALDRLGAARARTMLLFINAIFISLFFG